MSEKLINAALLSFGMSGRVFHAPFIELHPGFKLLGAWERSTKKIQEHYPRVKSYSSIEEILADEEVELVVVNTPTYTHYDYAKKALEAGKHLVVEKAFTSNFEEAKELADIAASNNLKISIFQNRRWDSDFLTVKKVIQEGNLGDIVEAEFHYDRFNPDLSPKVHKETLNSGSGIVRDLGPHVLDQALSLFGMPQSVFADLRKMRKNTLVEDYFEILLLYPSLRVRLKGGYFYKETVPSFQVFGTKGSFLKSRSDRQEGDLLKDLKPIGTNWGKDAEVDYGTIHDENGKRTIESVQGNYFNYYEDIYQGLRKNKNFEVDIHAGLNSMKIIDLVFESAKEGKIIDL